MNQSAIAATEDMLARQERVAFEKKSKLILAVDDDSEILSMLANIGNRAGYTVHVATSGAECLSMLGEMTPHLIMLDVKMPGLDGFETCRRIRSDPKVAEVPVAFLTARRTAEDFKRGMAVGCDDFVIKPFNATRLLNRIQHLIARGHMPRPHGARPHSASQRSERSRAVLVALDPRIGARSDPEARPIHAAHATTPSLKSIDTGDDPNSDPGIANSIGVAVERGSLMQIVSMPLEPFLIQDNIHKAPGLISISILPLWWDALMAIAHDHLSAMQADLDRLLPLGDASGIEVFTETLRVVVASLTGRLVTMMEEFDASTPEAVKSLARAAGAIEIKLINEILQIAGALDRALASFTRVKLRETGSTSLRIADLSPRLVSEAKRCYTQLGDRSMAGQLFALAILNHLDKPWQIFRLARALSWKKEPAAVSHTELDHLIGDRVLLDLDDTAIAVNAVTTIATKAATAINFEDLAALVARYVETEGEMLWQIDLRRDSPWGASLLRSRSRMCAALDEDRLQHAADAILAPVQHSASAAASSSDPRNDAASQQAWNAINAAAASIRFLTYVAQRGEKHGFGSPARRILDALRDDIARRIEALLDQLLSGPVESATPDYLAQTAQLVQVLYAKDKRGPVLSGRLKAALKGKK